MQVQARCVGRQQEGTPAVERSRIEVGYAFSGPLNDLPRQLNEDADMAESSHLGGVVTDHVALVIWKR